MKMFVVRVTGAGVVVFRIKAISLTLVIWVVGILVSVDGFAVSQSGRLVVEVQSEGAPIAGAGVFVSQQEAFTDQQGRARLELAPGEHAVLIFAKGYLDLETLVIVDVDQEVDLLVELV
ncbi:MAG: carboxypeptidase regulatory-like domain-containing protein, partial [Acidobacteriota bacterium]